MFYKNENGQWLESLTVNLPGGAILNDKNKVSAGGWVWHDTPPYKWQSDEVENATLQHDLIFGNKLLKTFLSDNRNLAQAFSTAQSIGMLQKFGGVKALAEVGDVKNLKLLLLSLDTDAIYTQERKDKYVLMCTNHIASNI